MPKKKKASAKATKVRDLPPKKKATKVKGGGGDSRSYVTGY